MSLQTLLLMEGPTCSARSWPVPLAGRSAVPLPSRQQPPSGASIPCPRWCRAGRAARPAGSRNPPADSGKPRQKPHQSSRNLPRSSRRPQPQRWRCPRRSRYSPRRTSTRIQGIDAALAAALGKLGITRYEQIAAWMRGDIGRIEQSLGQPGRTNRENWIEQAQILAKGGETRYASRRARGETADRQADPDEGERRPIVQAAAATSTPLRACRLSDLGRLLLGLRRRGAGARAPTPPAVPASRCRPRCRTASVSAICPGPPAASC